GRGAFFAHALGVWASIGLIFYIMLSKYYEYQYVQAHVSDDLAPRYVFSAFWEGQEGSFLLWMFWHVALGLVLMFTARNWERPVLAVVSSVQVIIGSMLLGVYFGWGDQLIKFGSNPLLLLREVFDAPIFAQADYVEALPQMATGLNPSLQNYWMTIHPPTLFLGFASTLVPFAFAIAGLWTRDHQGWLRPALRWALFSGAILGTGILMGGAWAYEALNFGGYWAWDPVENTSLVPWLLLVAGIHTNLIAKATGHSIRMTYVFYLLTFVGIVYSTFLTRSGILGDTSVHAFTEMGLETQLLIFLGFAFFLGFLPLAIRWRSIPQPEREESAGSKELWMLIGSMVLLISSVLISAATSLPVLNAIMTEIYDWRNQVWDPIALTNPEEFHNRYQLWVAVFIALLSGIAQYLRWKQPSHNFPWRTFLSRSGLAAALALGMSLLTLAWIEVATLPYQAVLFTAWFTVFSNLDYLVTVARRNLRLAGSAFSHLGFGIMLVGILASGLNQRVISQNRFLMQGLTEDEEMARTTLLLIEDSPMVMENYRLTYVGDTIDQVTRTYFVDYERLDTAGQIMETFRLEPTLLYNRDFSKVAITNPSTKRYWNRDIFTVIMSIPEEETSLEAKQAKEDSLRYREVPLQVGQSANLLDTLQLQKPDTTLLRNYQVTLEAFSRHAEHPDYLAEPNDLGITAHFLVKASHQDQPQKATAAIVLRNGLLYQYPAQINPLSLRVKIDPKIFDDLLVNEDELDYQEFHVKPGEHFTIGGQQVTLEAFKPNPQVDHYNPMPGDISVSAVLKANNAAGQPTELQPVFIIRDKQAIRARDEAGTWASTSISST
ncbi:MAG: cytochrome c biogenesis protein CcsA, partial [Lewinella sp.]|nr:cytochrome c biogenesis protein CcsA [Lewinella sp.]